jgi:hypothetical protein
MSSNIDQILASLAAAFGHAEVRTACLKYASRKGGDKISISSAGGNLASKKSAPQLSSAAAAGGGGGISSASSVISDADAESVGSSVSSAGSKKKGKKEKAPKEKKESKPRGQSSWNIAVQETLTEMRDAYMETFVGENPEATEEEIKKATEKAITYKMAFARASEKKREADPDAQAKYEENKAKRLAKKAAKMTSAEAAKLPLPPSSNSSAIE